MGLNKFVLSFPLPYGIPFWFRERYTHSFLYAVLGFSLMYFDLGVCNLLENFWVNQSLPLLVINIAVTLFLIIIWLCNVSVKLLAIFVLIFGSVLFSGVSWIKSLLMHFNKNIEGSTPQNYQNFSLDCLRVQ